MAETRAKDRVSLRARITCPHCWHNYAPEDSLWISQHAELLGDPCLGPDQQLRFSPTRFNVDCAAIDARGLPCQSLACPRCHLQVPRVLLELEPLFLSILGGPGSGKSYFLTSMTWALRQTLPQRFAITFGDADPASNRSLNEYEERLFLNSDQDKLVALDKTALEGDLYNTVLLDGQSVSYPRPFIFAMRPLAAHPNAQVIDKLSRAICLYDNAGEHFLPGQDSSASPVTRHLSLSRVLFFLFDPTQDPRFRKACAEVSTDPQMRDRARTSRQETVLLEAADRIRRYTGLGQHSQHDRPLVIVVTKLDAWSHLLTTKNWDAPWKKTTHPAIQAIDARKVEEVSAELRSLLWKLTPELVSAAEGFAKEVVYMPVSAMGRGPEVDASTGLLGIRPRDLKPIQAEVPMIYSLARWAKGIIPQAAPRTAGNKDASTKDGTDPGSSGIVRSPRLRGAG